MLYSTQMAIVGVKWLGDLAMKESSQVTYLCGVSLFADLWAYSYPIMSIV